MQRSVAKKMQSGATLVELLVALAIISVMTVAGLGLTQAARQAYAGAERRQSVLDAIAARRFLAAQIESASPVVASVISGRPIIDFDGDERSLRFVSAEPVQAELPSLQRTRLFLEGQDLILERIPLEGGGEAERRIIARGISRLSLSYYDTAEGGGESPAARWRGRSAFPSLVLITAESVAGAPPWPALAARPRLAARW